MARAEAYPQEGIERVGHEGSTALESPQDGKRSMGELVRDLASETSTLFRKEAQLARTEMSEKFAELKKGATALASSGVVLLAGTIVLLMGAVYALALVMPLWASALIVGGVVCIIGAIMLLGGKKKLEASNLTPEQTMASLRQDRRLMKGHAATS